MAFLQHPRRRTTRIADEERGSQSGTNAIHHHAPIGSSSTSLRRERAPLGRSDSNEAQDWNVVFPGRSRYLDTGASASQSGSPQSASDPPSPFRDPEQAGGLELTLPPLHDGTGRFTRPSSPSYGADDELDEQSPADASPTSPVLFLDGPPSEVLTFDSFSDGELEFDDDDEEAEVASSLLYESMESGQNGRRRRNSNAPNQPRRTSRSSHVRDTTLGATSASSSWAWMNAAQSQHTTSHQSRRQMDDRESWDVVPAILTSDSEGEEESDFTRTRRMKEEAAYEEALNSAHLAQSAGIRARVPKRRHRKNGESEKGSKRSNNSAAVASELLSQRRRALQGRRSQTSVATSCKSRSRLASGTAPAGTGRVWRQSQGHGIESGKQMKSPKTERLLSAILQRLFGVDDDDVLEAFLRDEGPLAIEHETCHTHVAAASASRAPLGHYGDDDVWSRNQRQRHMRLLLDGQQVPEEVEEAEESEEEGETRSSRRETTRDTTYRDQYPQRSYVPGNVSEPSLSEALHATVLSGLRVVPSGLSLLLAGTNSVRFVNFLLDRVGPSLTDRIRKLIDEGVSLDEALEQESSATTTRSLRSNSVATDASSLRFKGKAHPAIASSSSQSTRSSSQSTVA